jgi:hypothetical protein
MPPQVLRAIDKTANIFSFFSLKGKLQFAWLRRFLRGGKFKVAMTRRSCQPLIAHAQDLDGLELNFGKTTKV